MIVVNEVGLLVIVFASHVDKRIDRSEIINKVQIKTTKLDFASTTKSFVSPAIASVSRNRIECVQSKSIFRLTFTNGISCIIVTTAWVSFKIRWHRQSENINRSLLIAYPSRCSVQTAFSFFLWQLTTLYGFRLVLSSSNDISLSTKSKPFCFCSRSVFHSNWNWKNSERKHPSIVDALLVDRYYRCGYFSLCSD